MKFVICNKCKWVRFEVSREYAETEVQKFNEFFDTLTKERQDEFYSGKKSNISFYEYCQLCNSSYKTYRDALEEEIPVGSTVSPIIAKED